MRAFISSLLVILAGILQFSCQPAKDQGDAITLLTLKGPSAMGMVHILDSPSTISKNFRVEILDEPMQVRARMLVEKPELAVLPLNMAAILYNNQIDYKLLAIPVWGTLYLFGSDSTVSDWKDLKGKTVHLMGRGATPDILFRLLLEAQGLRVGKDVILDYSFPTHIDLSNAVIAGRSGLAVISEPLVSLAQSRNPDIRQVMDLNREWASVVPDHPDLPQTALLVRKDFADRHPEWVQSLCAAWSQSINRVNLNPAEAAARIAFHRILPDSATAARSIPRCNLKFEKAEDVRPAITAYLKVFLNFNPDAVGGQIPDEAFIYQKPSR